MGDKSAIEWTDATWNPVVGCDRVSPGCDNCYAIAMSKRIQSTGNEAYQGLVEGGDWTGVVRCLPERLDQPLRWKRPRRIFVNSMSDLFHPDVPDEFIVEVFERMSLARQHQFQILTKRPQRMSGLLSGWADKGAKPPANVWLGTSIETDRYTFRADRLRETPAAVRFLSLEPLLGPLPSLDLTGIDWVIVGGESGPGARPMHPDWVREIRDKCLEAKVPFFFKQWGGWAPSGRERATHLMHGNRPWLDGGYALVPIESVTSEHFRHGHSIGHLDLVDRGHPGWVRMRHAGKRANGRELDGRTWDEYPEAT